MLDRNGGIHPGHHRSIQSQHGTWHPIGTPRRFVEWVKSCGLKMLHEILRLSLELAARQDKRL